MSVDTLVELSRSPATSSPVGQGEVVEDKEVARPQGNLDLNGGNVKIKTREEGQFRGQVVELHPAHEAGGGPHARQPRHACCPLYEPRQTALGVAILIVPRSVRLAVGDQVMEERRPIRPPALAKEGIQRHQARCCRDPDRGPRDEECGISRDILIVLWVEREAKVEVERLKVAGRFAVGRREDESPITLSGPWRCDAVHSSTSSWDLMNAASGVANSDRIQMKPVSRSAAGASAMARLQRTRRSWAPAAGRESCASRGRWRGSTTCLMTVGRCRSRCRRTAVILEVAR